MQKRNSQQNEVVDRREPASVWRPSLWVWRDRAPLPVVTSIGGLRRLLHLSEEADTMTVYCVPQAAPCSSQELKVLLQEMGHWSGPSAVTTYCGEPGVFSQLTRIRLLPHSWTAVMFSSEHGAAEGRRGMVQVKGYGRLATAPVSMQSQVGLTYRYFYHILGPYHARSQRHHF